jgi:hypothetical protein
VAPYDWQTEDDEVEPVHWAITTMLVFIAGALLMIIVLTR